MQPGGVRTRHQCCRKGLHRRRMPRARRERWWASWHTAAGLLHVLYNAPCCHAPTFLGWRQAGHPVLLLVCCLLRSLRLLRPLAALQVVQQAAVSRGDRDPCWTWSCVERPLLQLHLVGLLYCLPADLQPGLLLLKTREAALHFLGEGWIAVTGLVSP